MITISHKSKIIDVEVALPSSKSISNRLLVIHYLMKQSFKIENLSSCNDTIDLHNALKQLEPSQFDAAKTPKVINVGEAGTSFRFLTALLATLPGQFELCGSEKLMQRPITPLVAALNSLGAKIETKFDNVHGPLLIKGNTMLGGTISIDASTSSQFITALMLVAPYFKNGLTIQLQENIVSRSYINMTLSLMHLFGATVSFNDNIIKIDYGPYTTNLTSYKVESDWTAASYWYAFATLSKSCNIVLKGLFKQSLQGDCLVAELFSLCGIKSTFNEDSVTLVKSKNRGFITGFDFVDNPDLVQTFAFLNASLGQYLQVNNAANLRLKETDRISAIASEIKKMGGKLVLNTNDDFFIENKQLQLQENAVFETYQDHRMAMSTAALALVFDEVKIANEQVVEKSYPAFWEHLAMASFEVTRE